MPIARCAWLVPVLLAAAAGTAEAQAPTLPSDTLKANFAPPSRPGPSPSLAPTQPTDTLDVNADPARPDGTRLPLPAQARAHHRHRRREGIGGCGIRGREHIGLREERHEEGSQQDRGEEARGQEGSRQEAGSKEGCKVSSFL